MAITHHTQPTLLDRILDESPDKIKARMSRSRMLLQNAQQFDLMLSDLLLYVREMQALGAIMIDQGKAEDQDWQPLLERIEKDTAAYLKEHLPHGLTSDKTNSRSPLRDNSRLSRPTKL